MMERHGKLYMEPVRNGPDAPLGTIGEHDSAHLGHNVWDPDAYVEKGWTRHWGDAAVGTSFFEILRKQTDEGAEFLILCPSLLRRPIHITTTDPRAWGSY